MNVKLGCAAVDQRALGLAFAVLWAAGCNSVDDRTDRPIARAYDQVLHWSDLRQMVPLDLSAKDSAAMAQQVIDAWLRQQVVLRIAESNLSEQGLDFEDQLQEYRRSLVIFSYEQALVEQKLDTLVSDDQIASYYQENKVNFELKDTMLQARWFKVNEPDKRVLRKMEERFLDGGSEQMHELELWLARSGVIIADRSGTWIPGSDLRTEVPMTDDMAKVVMGGPGKHVLRGENAAWFVEILDQRAMGSVSPIELVQQDIRAIVLNQRKLQLIGAMRKSVFEQAVEKKDVEIYAH